MALFEEHKNNLDLIVMERANNWAISIGLQRVDGLNVSDFLIQVACQKIEGKVTMDEAQTLINAHYTHMKSNRSSYEIIPPNSDVSKIITEYNKARRPWLYK